MLAFIWSFYFLNAHEGLGGEYFNGKGHRDVLGDAEANRTLSFSRTKGVADFLISKGISENRISYHGYGSTQPQISKPVNEEERAVNRRVEFVIK